MNKNLDGSEKRISKSFRIEESLYDEFKRQLKENKAVEDLGLTAGAWIRKQIILYLNNKKPDCG